MKTLTFEMSDALYEAFQQMATTYDRTLGRVTVLHSTAPFLPDNLERLPWWYVMFEITV